MSGRNTRSRSMLALGLVATVALSTGCSDTSQLEDLFGIDVYFVKLNEEPAKVAATATALADDFGLKIIHTYDAASEGFSVKLPKDLIPDVESLDQVDYVLVDEKKHGKPPEEDPVDDPIEDPKPILGDGEVPESIERISGPYLGGGLSQVHVAVIDSGIDAGHPDLNVVGEIDIVAQSGAGAAAPGWDPNGHGTHCAGTIGAIADGEGVVGVAPGVPLHAVRVLNAEGSGYWSDIIAGLEYVLDHPEIRVVSMSLGGPAMDGPDPLQDAIQRVEDAGVVVVIAAGNETDDADFHSPASYDIGLVVSAYDASGGRDNGFAWFSNYGDQVDIAAPGVDVLSTYPGGVYTELSGTSMATPAVAGAAAAYLAQNPNKTPKQVRNAIVDTGENGYKGQKGDHPEPLLDLNGLL